MTRLPLAPLLARVASSIVATEYHRRPTWGAATFEVVRFRGGLAELARRTGEHPRQVQRWKHRGIPLERADSMAIALGLHPAEVWGDEWWEAAAS